MASESVKVVVRCRPMNQRERELNCQPVVTVDSARGQCFIQNPGAAGEPPKQFTFDGAYYMDHFTEQIYNEIAYPLVEVRAPGRPPPPRTGRAGLGAAPRGPEGRHCPQAGQKALLETHRWTPAGWSEDSRAGRRETAGARLLGLRPGLHCPRCLGRPHPQPSLPLTHKHSSPKTPCPAPSSESCRTSLNSPATFLGLLLPSQESRVSPTLPPPCPPPLAPSIFPSPTPSALPRLPILCPGCGLCFLPLSIQSSLPYPPAAS